MKLVLLWTDILVWSLMIVLFLWSWVISRSPQIKKQWHTIFKSSIAMASSTVLLFYLLFTLLDSIHLRLALPIEVQKSQEVVYESEMVSLLDLIFEHNIQNTERTYSAPFATVEYASSIMVDENGMTKQVHLPLKHVSTKDNFVKESLFAFGVGLILSLSLVVLHIWWRERSRFMLACKETWQGESDLPWRTAYVTFIFLVMAFTWLYMLSYSYHVLGTDKVGGDVLYQSFKSIRTGVLIEYLPHLLCCL
jgi:peptide/nickel transport system permease protein